MKLAKGEFPKFNKKKIKFCLNDETITFFIKISTSKTPMFTLIEFCEGKKPTIEEQKEIDEYMVKANQYSEFLRTESFNIIELIEDVFDLTSNQTRDISNKLKVIEKSFETIQKKTLFDEFATYALEKSFLFTFDFKDLKNIISLLADVENTNEVLTVSSISNKSLVRVPFLKAFGQSAYEVENHYSITFKNDNFTIENEFSISKTNGCYFFNKVKDIPNSNKTKSSSDTYLFKSLFSIDSKKMFNSAVSSLDRKKLTNVNVKMAEIDSELFKLNFQDKFQFNFKQKHYIVFINDKIQSIIGDDCYECIHLFSKEDVESILNMTSDNYITLKEEY